MASINIIEAFGQPLPHDIKNAPAHMTHISGHSTELATPPAFAYEASQTGWEAYANGLLGNPIVNSTLRTQRLASWENIRYLDVEGDVGDAAAVHLINPVDLALSAGHDSDIRSLNQHTVKADHVGLHNARADKCWAWYDRHEIPTYFAVLDYKKIGTIQENEFTMALAPARQSFQANVDQAFGLRAETFFEKNSYILLKQAVNYADQYNTRYIAYFDWRCLVLLHLTQANESDGGDCCYVTFVKGRKNFRRALLGFLERAYQSSVRGEDAMPRFGPYPPPPPTNLGGYERSSRRGRR
ncbi:hypothetical protein G7Z17_g892 [Cylindrodendrum hubeiense]|uniref:Uncharacterized protein n=1 Tax=Cylindrodendrum hubeiense TaxID=595255 RepID=A0A9P5HR26_9HYPO|nr:hypothetical protein G7Z17_g892 [Cylindrodendrum hubeiense]